MAEKYMFFNSTPDDRRRHQASDMADYWSSFLSTGLIHKDGEPFLKLDVVEDTNKIKISKGLAVLKGHLYMNTDDLELTVPTGNEDKTYLVVLRWDNTIENRYIKFFVKEDGALTRTESIHELGLYKIKVKSNVTTVNKNDIEDLRLNDYYCGLAYSLVSVPTEYFLEQWKEFRDEYYKWYNEIKDESFAVEGDVKLRDFFLKREIAALKLSQDVNERIKNGNTFANDFKGNSFGLELLNGQAIVSSDVTAGASEINVESAHNLKIGDTATLFDATKSTTLKVTGVVGNKLILDGKVSATFKKGALIKQNMTVFDNGLKFGDYTSGYDINLDNTDMNGYYDVAVLLEDKIYAIEGKKDIYSISVYDGKRELLHRFSSAKEHILSYKTNDGSCFFVLGELNTSKFLNVSYVLIKNGRAISGDVSFSGHIATAGRTSYIIDEFTNPLTNVGDADYLCFLNIDGTNQRVIELKINNTGVVEQKKITLTTGNSNFLGSCAKVLDNYYALQSDSSSVVLYDSGGKEGNGIAGPGTSNMKYLSFLNKNGVLKGYDTAGTGRISEYSFREGGITREYVSVEQLMISKWFPLRSHRRRQFDSAVFIESADGMLHNPSPNFGDQLSIKAEYTASEDSLILNDVKKFFYLKGKRYAFAKHKEGETAKLLFNDVRFKIPPSKEVVTFIETKNSGTVTGEFGGVTMDKSSNFGETQLVGASGTSQNEFTLRMARTSTSTDFRITKLLGGYM